MIAMRWMTITLLVAPMMMLCATSFGRKGPEIQEKVLQPGERRYSIAIPDSYTGTEPVPLVLALHYGGEVTPYYGKRMLTQLVEPALRELGAIIVAPDCNAGNWTEARAEKDVLDLLAELGRTYNIDSDKILITGYSLGGMGTWHLAARHQDLFAAALVMAGRPGQEALGTQWKIPLYVIHSRLDQVVPLAPTEQAVEQLKARGVAVELVIVEGISHYESHRFKRHLKAAVPWIRQAWE
jgi:predicted peptidase